MNYDEAIKKIRGKLDRIIGHSLPAKPFSVWETPPPNPEEGINGIKLIIEKLYGPKEVRGGE